MRETEEGYAVDFADNGRDGLWHAKSGEYDAIVLDILLPHVNGIEILQSLRSNNNLVPVFLLTALDEVDQRIASRADTSKRFARRHECYLDAGVQGCRNQSSDALRRFMKPDTLLTKDNKFCTKLFGRIFVFGMRHFLESQDYNLPLPSEPD